MFEDLIKTLGSLDGRSVSVEIHADEKGYLDKQCPAANCEFRFKVNEDDWKNISSAKKHSLLGSPSEAIYDDLDQLRKLRNRVHIQNDKNDFEPNDSQAFSRDRQISGERTLEKLIKTISTNHPRPASVGRHVNDFQLPWDAHFP